MVISRAAILLSTVALLSACPEGIPIPPVSPTVAMPGGNYTMGATKDCTDEDSNEVCDPSSYAERPVFVSPFNIDRHEVTNTQYRYCVAQGACREPAATGLPEVPDYYTSSRYDQHPVIFVSWEMATEYCEFVGRRLPTEAEWEFAARTEQEGDNAEPRDYPWKWRPEETPVPNCAHARLDACKEDFPGAVESIDRDISDWGVRDLGGNVAEWVADLFWLYAYCRDEQSLDEFCESDVGCIEAECFDPLANPRADCVLQCDAATATAFCMKQEQRISNPRTDRGGPDRSLRGGSFIDGRCVARSFVRRHSAPDAARAWVGFRCAGSAN